MSFPWRTCSTCRCVRCIPWVAPFWEQLGQNRLALSPVWVLRLNRCEMFLMYMCWGLFLIFRFSANIHKSSVRYSIFPALLSRRLPSSSVSYMKMHTLLSYFEGFDCLCSPLGRPYRRNYTCRWCSLVPKHYRYLLLVLSMDWWYLMHHLKHSSSSFLMLISPHFAFE